MSTCRRCGAAIERIERYHVQVEWTREKDGSWSLGTYDTGSHFHLFCANGHEGKLWGRELPDELQSVVFPGERRTTCFKPRKKPGTREERLGGSGRMQWVGKHTGDLRREVIEGAGSDIWSALMDLAASDLEWVSSTEIGSPQKIALTQWMLTGSA